MNAGVFAAESAITQALVDGSLESERLRAVVRELDDGRYSLPLTALRQAMARSGASSVADGLCAILGDLHIRKRIPIAELQILAIGFYRLIWRLLTRLDPSVTLTEVRQLSAAQAAQVCYGFTFGLQPAPFPLPAPLCARLHARIRDFLGAEEVDRMWCASHPLPLGVPLVAAVDPELTPSANAIRNAVMAEAFTGDLLGMPVADDDALLADLLSTADAHSGRFAFLRQSDPPQARFRVRQVALAMFALHHQAASAGRSGTGVLLRETLIACLLSPFVSLRGWLRANLHGLSIPLVRLTPGGDALLVEAATPEDLSTGIQPRQDFFPLPPARQALA